MGLWGGGIAHIKRVLQQKWVPVKGSLWDPQKLPAPVRDPKELQPGAWLTWVKPVSKAHEGDAVTYGIPLWNTG